MFYLHSSKAIYAALKAAFANRPQTSVQLHDISVQKYTKPYPDKALELPNFTVYSQGRLSSNYSTCTLLQFALARLNRLHLPHAFTTTA
jgi:hypothetical protein